MYLNAIALYALLAWGMPKNAMFGVHISNIIEIPTYFMLQTVQGNKYRDYFINLHLNFKPFGKEDISLTDSTDSTLDSHSVSSNEILLSLRIGTQSLKVKPIKNFSNGVALNLLTGLTPFAELSLHRTKQKYKFDIRSETIIRSSYDGGVGLTGTWGLEAKFKLFDKDMAVQILHSIFTSKIGYRYELDLSRNDRGIEAKRARKIPYIDLLGSSAHSGRISVWLLVEL